jgi:hypothetical protein
MARKKSANKEEALPCFNFRIPHEVAIAMKVDAAKLDLYNGEFIVQMFHFAKAAGVIEWLKSDVSNAREWLKANPYKG